jgi:hypothetical protein
VVAGHHDRVRGLFSARSADEGRELPRTYAGTLSDGMLANTADTGQTEQ